MESLFTYLEASLSQICSAQQNHRPSSHPSGALFRILSYSSGLESRTPRRSEKHKRNEFLTRYGIYISSRISYSGLFNHMTQHSHDSQRILQVHESKLCSYDVQKHSRLLAEFISIQKRIRPYEPFSSCRRFEHYYDEYLWSVSV